MKQLNRICPGQRPPRVCRCSSDDKHQVIPPFAPRNAVQLFFCKVNRCQCHNGLWVDARPKAVKAIEVCDSKVRKGHVESCRCRGGNRIKAPFDVNELFIECNPRTCDCNDGQSKNVTKLGCESGGNPGCPIGSGPLRCQDGSELNAIEPTGFIFGRKKSCICQDGKMPICEKSLKRPICLEDESEPDWKRAPDFLAKCQ